MIRRPEFSKTRNFFSGRGPMEYEGAGSFWSQLTITQEDQLGSTIVSRRIDELLRNPLSSLVDILLDDEAISEFRSGNQKLVSRITEVDGMNMLLNLITSQEVDSSLTDSQRQQLPFVAAEFVACEVDAMLDAFTRVVPGQRTPLDRLFDFLILGNETNPTVLGYLVRVLLVYTNRRVDIMDKYIAEHHDAIADALIEKVWDRSIADLMFRFCLDEDIRSFRLDFNKLFSHLSEATCDNIVWLIDSIFGKPLLASNDKVTVTFNHVSEDLISKGGLEKLSSAAFGDSSIASASCDILAILVQYSFTRPAVTERGLSLGDSSTPTHLSGWETFSTKPATPATSSRMDDDSCVFDDELASPQSAATIPKTKDVFTAFGSALVSASIHRFSESKPGIGSDVVRDFSLLKLMARCVQYQEFDHVDPEALSALVCEALIAYPRSSAVHNLCRDCVVMGVVFSFPELKQMARRLGKELEAITALGASSRSQVGRMLCFLQESLGNAELLEQIGTERCALAESLIKEWQTINTRLVDRQDKVPTRVPSPHGVTPIIDLNEQWASMDFAASFPVPADLFPADENAQMAESALSPQVRFEDPSLDASM